jgi:RHS repeat-associated protein
MFSGRRWDPQVGLYRFSARWYDPGLGRFLTPDAYTGAPDDARTTNPVWGAGHQAVQRAELLDAWLKRPRCRNPYAYCGNDPLNLSDPNGHWSFGGVLLSLLGAIWTLPNTLFGILIEISCLLGEVIRWLVWLATFGHVSWATPGFDVASSGHLNAFALVFRGGWLGSIPGLLGMTFGNVFFVNHDWENNSYLQSMPDPVSPSAYKGKTTIPRDQALYEHELRHTNQYAWFGPFFHLGLPIFGVYEWDWICSGFDYGSMWLERDAQEHGGF